MVALELHQPCRGGGVDAGASPRGPGGVRGGVAPEPDRRALPELAAEDVRLAARSLGRITGRVDVEDVLDVIFRDFCIGK